MTDEQLGEQIIKALECCINGNCDDCYNVLFYCMRNAITNALGFISRQKARIKELEERISYLEESIDCSRKEYNRLLQKMQQLKSEAIKEFAERLKNKIWYSDWCNLERTITPEIITTVVKEMTEVQK